MDATIGQSQSEIDVSVTADSDFVHRRSKKKSNSFGISPANGIRRRPCDTLSVASGCGLVRQVARGQKFSQTRRFLPKFETAPNELQFVSGHQLDQESASQIPASMMGRLLDDGDLRKLQWMLVKKKPPAPSVRRPATAKRKVGKP